MGMRPVEYFLFGSGAVCLVFFLFQTGYPYFRSRLDDTASATSKRLREEFLSVSHDHVRGILLSAGGVAAIAAMISTKNVLLTAVLGISPGLLSGVLVRHLRARRRKKVVSQLPGFLEILSGHVKAGHSILESLNESIPLLPSGIREEISWLCQTVRLGTPFPDALLAWDERMACDEIAMIVRPLRIAVPAGGNLYDLLARCRDVIRAKMRHAERMRSMTAQARLQALVLTLLPPGFIAVLARIEPHYLSRCLETTAGRTILAAAGTLQLLGWLSIRRIMGANR